MKCWNCLEEMPDSAKVCPHCEAAVEEPPDPEMEQVAADVLQNLDPAAMAELRQALESSSTAEEFANRLMIGNCPRCGSTDTGDCGEDPEIENPSIGRCYACGCTWCADCGEVLDGKPHDCPFWEDDEGAQDA